MKTNKEQMRSLLATDTPIEQLREQHQKLLDLRQQADSNRFETMIKIRQTLTPEQRAKMAQLRKQHLQNRGNRQPN